MCIRDSNNPFFSVVDYVSNDYFKKLNRPSIYATFPLSLIHISLGAVFTTQLVEAGKKSRIAGSLNFQAHTWADVADATGTYTTWLSA